MVRLGAGGVQAREMVSLGGCVRQCQTQSQICEGCCKRQGERSTSRWGRGLSGIRGERDEPQQKMKKGTEEQTGFAPLHLLSRSLRWQALISPGVLPPCREPRSLEKQGSGGPRPQRQRCRPRCQAQRRAPRRRGPELRTKKNCMKCTSDKKQVRSSAFFSDILTRQAF